MDKHVERERRIPPVKVPEPEEGELRVWWIPQVPGPCFYAKVTSVQEASHLLQVLAEYDLFQYKNKIKPDYSNTGGLEVYKGGSWEEWESGDYESIDDVIWKGYP